MENKNPPKKLKKKLPKEPLSGGGEKKLKAKGECPALLPLASVPAGGGKCLAPRPCHCPGRLRGLQSHCPSPCDPPLAQPFLLLRSCHLLVPITYPFPSPVWLVISSSVPAEDKSDPESKAKSAKSTKKEPMSVFQVKKEKKSKKKGMGRAGEGGSQSCCLMASP